jgi:hypothetical protein
LAHSEARMHGHCTFPRGNGKASFEGLRRFGTNYIHGMTEAIVQSNYAKSLFRNMTFGIHSRWRKVSDILMSSTILSGECTPPSMLEAFHNPRIVTEIFRNFDLEDVHVEGAERISEAVAKYDVDRFIHVSSYNADLNSPSEFFRTKVGLSFLFVNTLLILHSRPAVNKLFAASSQKQLLSDQPLYSDSKIAYSTNLLE